MTASTRRSQVEKSESNCSCDGPVGGGSKTMFVFSPRMSVSSRCVSAELVSSKAVFMCRRFSVRTARFTDVPVPIALDNEGSVATAEAQGVAHRDVDAAVTGYIRNAIQIAFRIGKFIIDRRWNNVVAHGEAAGCQLDRAARALHVSERRLERTHGQIVRVLAKSLLDDRRFCAVAQRCRSAVRIEVIHLFRAETRPGEGDSETTYCLCAIRIRLAHVIGVAGGRPTGQLRVNPRLALQGVLEFFHDQHASALGHDKPVTLPVEWT